MLNNGTAFGVWLKQRRKSLGLPVKELAERVGCSRMTILKIEAGERRPSGQIAELLAAELDVPQRELSAFVEFSRANLPANYLSTMTSAHERSPWVAFEKHSKESSYPINLPAPPTAFIGRETQIEKAVSLVGGPSVRLLTFTGPPGIGKTRLSLQVAARLRPDFRDGVFFVPLAPIRDPALVITAIAQALKVRETASQLLLDSLTNYLRDKQTLLLLDNFEQVVDAGTLVAGLMSSAAELKALVTSREALHIYGEYIFPVPPMSLPDAAGRGQLIPVDSLAQYEAISLFTERATAADINFALNDENVADVADVCARLDGLPLALELAAARMGTMSPGEIASRLESRAGAGLNLLAGGPRDLSPRQQTLRNAIDWSYSLIDPEEQALFRVLSAFVGGSTAEAIEAVFRGNLAFGGGIGSATTLASTALLSLVDKSLVWQEQKATRARFGMLETIREYAGELLVESGDEAAVMRCHAGYYCDLAEAAEPQLKGPDQAEWLERLEVEHDNLRAALRWSLEQGRRPKIALRLGAALWRFWLVRGHLSEGRNWLERALSSDESSQAHREFASSLRDDSSQAHGRTTDDKDSSLEESALANALNGAGNLAYSAGDLDLALALQERNLALRREIGDKPGLAGVLNNLAVIWRDRGDYERASALFRESLDLKRALGDRAGIASSLTNLAVVMVRSGNYSDARASDEESLVIWRDLGDKYGVATVLTNLGVVASSQGDYAAARSLHAECLEIRRELGDKLGIAVSLSNLGNAALRQEDYETARKLFEESLQAHRELGDKSGIGHLLRGLGAMYARLGDYAKAIKLARESLEIRRDMDDRRSIAECLALLARALLGQYPDSASVLHRAAAMLGATEQLLAAGGFDFYPVDREQYEEGIAIALSGLGAVEFQNAKAEGEAMSLPETIYSALREMVAP